MNRVRIEPAAGAPAAAIDRCLEAVEDRDPLVIPVEFEARDQRTAFVALDGDEVVGVGWLRALGDEGDPDAGHRVEVRVAPGHRRRGVGAALFARLDARERTLLASCDAGQSRARRFLEARGFTATGVIFVQRWDGEPADVPRAFRSVTLEPGEPGEVAALLIEASAGSWPPPMFGPALLADAETRLRVARLDTRPVGALTARRIDGAWTIGGLAVRPDARRRGAGRALLCDLMREAAVEGVGVVLRVGYDDEQVLGWTRRLGFWTCRSFVAYRRAAEVSARASEVLA